MDKIHLVFAVLIWLFSVFELHVVSLPINFLDSKSNVYDKLQQTDTNVVVASTVNPTEGLPSDYFKYVALYGPETTTPHSPLGLRLFPKFVPNKMDQKKPVDRGPVVDRPSLVRLFPKPQAGGGGNVGGGKKKEIGGIIPARAATEKTISVPKFKTDYLGNWVYNPWGVTYGQVFRDTRFMPQALIVKWITHHKKAFDNKAIPKKKVCNSFSAIYNVPRVMEYLKKPAYNYVHNKVPIYKELRLQIYKEGNSEECHTKEMTHWRTFMECSIMRHMRMEYLVPRYPLRQTADWDYTIHFPGRSIDDDPEYKEPGFGMYLDEHWGEVIAPGLRKAGNNPGK